MIKDSTLMLWPKLRAGALNTFRRVNSLIAKQSVTSLRSFYSLQHSFREDIASYPSTTQKRFLCGKKTEKSVQIGNPCIDGVFQYGFSEPSILSDFLNAALELKEEQSIEDIQYLPKDLTSPNPMSPLRYSFTVDVRCRTKEGRHFLVEIQNDFRDDYHLKALIEHARMLSRLDVDQNFEDQAQREENNKNDKKKFWKSIQGLYAIVITNKTFPFSSMKSYYTSEFVVEPLLVNPYELRHTYQLDRHYGDVPNQIVLVMLNNLKKSTKELSSPIERWAYLFKDDFLRTGVNKILETKEIQDPDVVAGPDKAITAFIDRVNIKNLPREVREDYIRSLNYYNTAILDIEVKAFERGIEKVAKNMLKSRKPIEEIMELTGLSKTQIKNLEP